MIDRAPVTPADPASAAPRRAAFFDLDRTVIDCNSARLWIVDELRAGRMRWRTAAWAGYHVLRYSLGRTGLDTVYAQAVNQLAGTKEAEFAQQTATWFARRIASRLRPGASAAINSHREAGDLLVLATSSHYLVAREARLAWGFDQCIASEFEVRDGTYTGGIISMAFGDAKAARAREWAIRSGIDLSCCAFYTDSLSDLALLESVGWPVVVNPDRKLRAIAVNRGWPIEDWGRSRRNPA